MEEMGYIISVIPDRFGTIKYLAKSLAYNEKKVESLGISKLETGATRRDAADAIISAKL